MAQQMTDAEFAERYADQIEAAEMFPDHTILDAADPLQVAYGKALTVPENSTEEDSALAQFAEVANRHGGKREGAGRPKAATYASRYATDPQGSTPIRIPNATLAYLEHIASEEGVTVIEWLNRLEARYGSRKGKPDASS